MKEHPIIIKHKKTGCSRKTKDEADVQKMVTTILENMVNPFALDQPEKQLVNIETGTVPIDVTNGLTGASEVEGNQYKNISSCCS